MKNDNKDLQKELERTLGCSSKWNSSRRCGKASTS